jgi:hypothetical protein
VKALAVLAAGAALAPGGLAVTGETNVSRARGVQSEVSVAVSPVDPKVLVAGSNNYPGKSMRAYSSTDGGATWTSTDDPPVPHAEAGGCAAGDPAV